MKRNRSVILCFVLIAIISAAMTGCGNSAGSGSVSYKKVEPTDGGAYTYGCYMDMSFNDMVASSNVAYVIRGELLDIEEYELVSNRYADTPSKRYESLLEIKINEKIWGDNTISEGNMMKVVFHDTSYARFEEAVKMEKGQEYIFLVSHTVTEDDDYNTAELSGYCVQSPEFYAMKISGDTIYFNNYSGQPPSMLVEDAEKTDERFTNSNNMNSYTTTYSAMKSRLIELMESIGE